MRPVNVFVPLVLATLVCGTAPAAWAQHPGPAPPAAAPSGGTTVDIQGADSWRRDPFMHKFHDALIAAFAKGPDKVDAAAFEKTSFVLFREFATSRGQSPDAMQDHLKLVPRQMIKIAREDPQVLKNFDDFLDAMLGPK